MGNTLKDKVAVITGAGRGLGKAYAKAFAEEGTKVVVNDLGGARDGSGASTQIADEVVSEIKKMGGEAVANYDSVSTFEGGEKVIQTAVNSFGKIDILVNNAGILRDRMLFNMTPEEWDIVIKVHLYGTFNCSRPAAVLMRQQKSGRIINVTSPTWYNGNPGQANYGAAKSGIVGFTRVAARDLGRYGITVNAVCPMAATRFLMPEEELAAAKAKAAEQPGPLPLFDPEDNAPILLFLASDAAANINGCVFGSRGGAIDLHPDTLPIKTIYKEGRWTLGELIRIMPNTLAKGLVNPAPPQPPKEK